MSKLLAAALTANFLSNLILAFKISESNFSKQFLKRKSQCPKSISKTAASHAYSCRLVVKSISTILQIRFGAETKLRSMTGIERVRLSPI